VERIFCQCGELNAEKERKFGVNLTPNDSTQNLIGVV
jgi:hypothetical protein